MVCQADWAGQKKHADDNTSRPTFRRLCALKLSDGRTQRQQLDAAASPALRGFQ